MKKKTLWILCAVVIVVAVAAMLIFVNSGENSGKVNELQSMEGTWKVAAYIDNGNASVVENEFMVFDAEKVTDYRDGSAYVSSAYSIDSSNLMELTDISRKYTVSHETDNYVRLYEGKDTRIDLIRYSDPGMKALTVDTASITGRWDIKYRNTDSVYSGDYLLFEDGNISQYSASAGKIVATAEQTWENGNHMVVKAWGKDLVVYPLSTDVILMVEQSSDVGFIWELHRAS